MVALMFPCCPPLIHLLFCLLMLRAYCLRPICTIAPSKQLEQQCGLDNNNHSISTSDFLNATRSAGGMNASNEANANLHLDSSLFNCNLPINGGQQPQQTDLFSQLDHEHSKMPNFLDQSGCASALNMRLPFLNFDLQQLNNSLVEQQTHHLQHSSSAFDSFNNLQHQQIQQHCGGGGISFNIPTSFPSSCKFEDVMMKIQLKANDEQILEVERNVIRLSSTLNTMFQDLGLDAGDADMLSEPITLDKVDGPMLARVIEWCKHHVNDPLPTAKDAEMDEPRTDDIPAWDVEFLKELDNGTLFQLIMAANYLEVRGLLDSACKTVANMIKGKKPEEIRSLFNIDFTPDEEAKIRAENGWVED